MRDLLDLQQLLVEELPDAFDIVLTKEHLIAKTCGKQPTFIKPSPTPKVVLHAPYGSWTASCHVVGIIHALKSQYIFAVDLPPIFGVRIVYRHAGNNSIAGTFIEIDNGLSHCYVKRMEDGEVHISTQGKSWDSVRSYAEFIKGLTSPLLPHD